MLGELALLDASRQEGDIAVTSRFGELPSRLSLARICTDLKPVSLLFAVRSPYVYL